MMCTEGNNFWHITRSNPLSGPHIREKQSTQDKKFSTATLSSPAPERLWLLWLSPKSFRLHATFVLTKSPETSCSSPLGANREGYSPHKKEKVVLGSPEIFWLSSCWSTGNHFCVEKGKIDMKAVYWRLPRTVSYQSMMVFHQGRWTFHVSLYLTAYPWWFIWL